MGKGVHNPVSESGISVLKFRNFVWKILLVPRLTSTGTGNGTVSGQTQLFKDSDRASLRSNYKWAVKCIEEWVHFYSLISTIEEIPLRWGADRTERADGTCEGLAGCKCGAGRGLDGVIR